MSQLKVNSIVDAAGGSSAILYGVASPPNSMGFRNRIINGEMRIDQRNAGASVTPTVSATYTVDRWQVGLTVASKFSVQQNAGAVTPPTGFSNYLGCTSLSAYAIGAGDTFRIQQPIEGFNTADLAWGTASAQAVTLSFRVYSSLTGTFGGAIYNSAGTRSYPFSYSVPVANTWTTVSVTISGDTTGTWVTNNGVGMYVAFSLGTGSTYSAASGSWAAGFYVSATGATSVVGTSGATFYITGVQLEAGSVASPFQRIDYGRQLIQCQRYYAAGYAGGFAGCYTTNGWITGAFSFPVTMRAIPTVTFTASAAGVIGTPTANGTTATGCRATISATGTVNANAYIDSSYTAAIEL